MGMKRRLFVGLLFVAGLGFAGSAFGAEPLLITAVKAGDDAKVAELLHSHADVNAATSDGTTALIWAVHDDNVPLVKMLIKAGAKVNVANDYGSSPMYEAAVTADTQLIETLLKAGANVESPNKYNQTALMVVARTNNVDAAKLLIKHGADVNAKETWRDQTAVMWAAAQCQPAMIKLLIDHGAKVNIRSRVNHWDRQVTAERRAQWRAIGGLTPLMYAARVGCVDAAKELVKGGADPNMADPEGMTPMIMATDNFHFDFAAYLLSAGADPNRWDWRGRTPLYLAIDLNTTPHGGRPDRPTTDKTSALDLVDLLFKAGANPNPQLKLWPPYRNLKDDRGADPMLTIGSTPLLRAAKAFDVEGVKMLLAHGANPNLPSSQGITPVMAAAGLGSTKIDTRGYFTTEDVQQKSLDTLKVLLASGADVNQKDMYGESAVFGAAMWGWTNVVKYLADHNADLGIKDIHGSTVIDAANAKVKRGFFRGGSGDPHPDTIKLLKSLMPSTASISKP
jgi:ankyrin repeat protein